MEEQASLEALYRDYSHLLFAIAYRMLGSASEAEDIVQECYLRYSQASLEEIHTPRSYLTTSVTNLCLDSLKSARRQREQYAGIWLPEPLLTPDHEMSPWQTVEQHESIALAFVLLLERLTAYERAVFLLREVFSFPYEEIATMVGKSATYCRQIFHQAKKHLKEKRAPVAVPSQEAQRQLVERFLQACQQGDMQALIELLEQDVTWWADGGGKVYAAPYPLAGREKVVHLLQGLFRLSPQFCLSMAPLNGSVGILAWKETSLLAAVSFQMTAKQISALYSVVNPDKLAYLQKQVKLPD